MDSQQSANATDAFMMLSFIPLSRHQAGRSSQYSFAGNFLPVEEFMAWRRTSLSVPLARCQPGLHPLTCSAECEASCQRPSLLRSYWGRKLPLRRHESAALDLGKEYKVGQSGQVDEGSCRLKHPVVIAPPGMAAEVHSTALAEAGAAQPTHSSSRRIDPSGLGSRSSPRHRPTDEPSQLDWSSTAQQHFTIWLRNCGARLTHLECVRPVVGRVRFKSIILCRELGHLLSELQLAAG